MVRLECEHFNSITADIIIKITRTGAAIAGPIMAAMLSGLPEEVVGGAVDAMVGVGVTTAVPGARIDSCAPGVSSDPSPEPSGGIVVQ